MLIGIPKERKPQETRVGLTPKWVHKLTDQGHIVYAENGLGENAGYSDDEYIKAGAIIIETAEELYSIADYIVKIKDFTEAEVAQLPFKEHQIISTFFHLGEHDPHPEVVKALLDNKVTGIALELIIDNQGKRKIIKPMSEIAGQLAIVEGMQYSQRYYGGRGVHFFPMEGIEPKNIVIMGAGSSGKAAIKASLSVGANVIVLQRKGRSFDDVKKQFPSVTLMEWSRENCCEAMKIADLFVNCVYPNMGMELPMVDRKMLKNMKPGTVLVDLAGCGIIETWRFTKISDPIFWEEGILHYGVDNMPALVPETACEAFSASIYEYVEQIANHGIKEACCNNSELRSGVCFYDGKIVHRDVAETHAMKFEELDTEKMY